MEKPFFMSPTTNGSKMTQVVLKDAVPTSLNKKFSNACQQIDDIYNSIYQLPKRKNNSSVQLKKTKNIKNQIFFTFLKIHHFQVQISQLRSDEQNIIFLPIDSPWSSLQILSCEFFNTMLSLFAANFLRMGQK